MSNKKKDNLVGNFFSDNNSKRLKMENSNNSQDWKRIQYDLLIIHTHYQTALHNMFNAIVSEPAVCFPLYKSELDYLAEQTALLKARFDLFYEAFVEAESASTHIKDRNFH